MCFLLVLVLDSILAFTRFIIYLALLHYRYTLFQICLPSTLLLGHIYIGFLLSVLNTFNLVIYNSQSSIFPLLYKWMAKLTFGNYLTASILPFFPFSPCVFTSHYLSYHFKWEQNMTLLCWESAQEDILMDFLEIWE